MSLSIAYNNLSVAPLDGAVALDFLAATLDSRITFTRASTKTYIGSDRVPHLAAVDVCPLEYSPATGLPTGRSFWNQRTNLLLRSNEFTDAAWTKDNTTVAAAEADFTSAKIAENSATSTHRLRTTTSVGITPSAQYVISAYVSPAGRQFVSMETSGGFEAAGTRFDLTAGTVSTGTGVITPVGSGIYRISLPVPAKVDGTTGLVWFVLYNGAGSYAGDGSSGVLLGRAQLEIGASASPYIPTTSASATRSADVASISDLAGIAFNPTYGTFLVQHAAASGAPLIGSSGAAVVASQGAGKIALAYTPSGTRKVHNGGSVTTGSALTFGTSLTIGSAGTSYANAPIARITYWPYPLPDAAMQALTA